MTESSYRRWRAVHLGASVVLGLLAVVHLGLTIPLYGHWGPDAVWFAGTGLGLLVLAGINLAYIGVEPCRQPTAKAVRLANYLLAGFGVAAVVAVPEVQAYIVLAALVGQAAAAPHTLPGT